MNGQRHLRLVSSNDTPEAVTDEWSVYEELRHLAGVFKLQALTAGLRRDASAQQSWRSASLHLDELLGRTT